MEREPNDCAEDADSPIFDAFARYSDFANFCEAKR